MILERLRKQPWDLKDYDIDYTPWLEPMGDSLYDYNVFITCLTNPDDTELKFYDRTPSGKFSGVTASKLKIWLGGGTDMERYKVTLQVMTTGGRKDEAELIIRVKDY